MWPGSAGLPGARSRRPAGRTTVRYLPGSPHAWKGASPRRKGDGVKINLWALAVNGILLGDDMTFMATFLVSFFFQLLGFLFTLCMGQSIAARSGGISGFGLR